MSVSGTSHTSAPMLCGSRTKAGGSNQAAVAAALQTDVFGRTHAAFGQIAHDGKQIVDAFVFADSLRRLMPARAELARRRVCSPKRGIALFQPVFADAAQIVRQLGYAETAVGINQGRRVGRGVFADVEIRNALAVGRSRPKLAVR